MRALPLSKFSSQANPEVLNTLREIAEAEGRKFHAVLDEAFRGGTQNQLGRARNAYRSA